MVKKRRHCKTHNCYDGRQY